MRLLTNKLARYQTDKKVGRHNEGRDAVVHDIDSGIRTAIITIQGSDEAVIARWPENWHIVPPFLRRGNAVRVYHPKGNPYVWELTQDSGSIPTPLDGSSPVPEQEVGEDVVIEGMGVVTHTTGVDGMVLLIDIGTYRIDGIVYGAPGLLMGDPAFDLMGEEPELSMGAEYGGIVQVPAAPEAPFFRVDMISIGSSGAISYTTGALHETDPVAPVLPSTQALIAYVIVPYEVTVIEQSWIGDGWVEPQLREVLMVMQDKDDPDAENYEMYYEDTFSRTVVVEMRDQYDKLVFGWDTISVEILDGNGSLSTTPDTTFRTFKQETGTCTFQYIRRGFDGITDLTLPNDISPTIKAWQTSNQNLYTIIYVQVFDSVGDLMYGQDA
jgi:hypothetical protein